MNLKDASRIVQALHGSGLAILLQSAPGVGKTTVIRETARYLAGKAGLEFYETRDPLPPGDGRLFVFHTRILSTYDAPDVRGYMLPQKGVDGRGLVSAFTWPDIFPPQAALARAGAVMLLLDEVGQAGHDVQKPAANIFLEQAIGEFSLRNYVPEGAPISVVGASNRLQDRSGVVRELAFLTNRLCVVDVEFDAGALSEWMDRNGYHPIATAFLAKNTGVVADAVPDKPGPFCSPRSFCNGVNAVMRLSKNGEVPTDKLATELLSGFIGQGAAAQFMAFAKHADELPERADVERAPMAARLPERPDSRFIVACYAAVWVSEANAGLEAVIKYVSRLPKDLQVMTVKSAIARNPGVLNSSIMIGWCRENKDLLVAAHA